MFKSGGIHGCFLTISVLSTASMMNGNDTVTNTTKYDQEITICASKNVGNIVL